MKRDLDLVRQILLWMEARPEGHNVNWEIEIEGFTEDEVGYQCHLMEQAGLILAADTTLHDSLAPRAAPLSITWAGHEFLDASRDSAVWAKAKDKVLAPAGGVAFTVLLEWLKAEVKSRLGLP